MHVYTVQIYLNVCEIDDIMFHFIHLLSQTYIHIHLYLYISTYIYVYICIYKYIYAHTRTSNDVSSSPGASPAAASQI